MISTAAAWTVMSWPARLVIVVVHAYCRFARKPRQSSSETCPPSKPAWNTERGQQLQTGVARERRRPLARRDAVALLVDRQDGDLQTVDQVAQTRLPFGVRRVVPRQFLDIEESAFERPLRSRRRRDERIHFADQHVVLGGMRQERHASGFARAARLGRLRATT